MCAQVSGKDETGIRKLQVLLAKSNLFIFFPYTLHRITPWNSMQVQQDLIAGHFQVAQNKS